MCTDPALTEADVAEMEAKLAAALRRNTDAVLVMTERLVQARAAAAYVVAASVTLWGPRGEA